MTDFPNTKRPTQYGYHSTATVNAVIKSGRLLFVDLRIARAFAAKDDRIVIARGNSRTSIRCRGQFRVHVRVNMR